MHVPGIVKRDECEAIGDHSHLSLPRFHLDQQEWAAILYKTECDLRPVCSSRQRASRVQFAKMASLLDQAILSGDASDSRNFRGKAAQVRCDGEHVLFG